MIKQKVSQKVIFEILKGSEGNALLLNNNRIAGPKAWGGGIITDSWIVELKELKCVIKDIARNE